MQSNKLFGRATLLLSGILKRSALKSYHKFLPCATMKSPPPYCNSPTKFTLTLARCLSDSRSGENSKSFNASFSSAVKNLMATLVVGIAGSLLAFRAFGLKPTLRVEAEALKDENSNTSGMSEARRKWNFIADIVDKAAPAVVHIEIQSRHPYTGKQVTTSNGSGFIVRSDGVILTNAHVVANKPSVAVRLHDGRVLTGTVQAIDPISDLATVKVTAKDLPTLKLGNSTELRTGEWVVAMGSPFQLNKTVTVGIVSSAERGSIELGLHNKDINYIQTDANITFGNSGGPLINLDGDAIGINTMMVTPGISFAIPSNYASDFLQKAKKIEGRTTTSKLPTVRGYVGITMLSLTSDIIKSLKTRHPDFPNVDHGVLIHRIAIGSPADSAGLRPGDVITRINDKDISTAAEVYAAVSSAKELRMTVHRGLDLLHVTVIPERAE